MSARIVERTLALPDDAEQAVHGALPGSGRQHHPARAVGVIQTPGAKKIQGLPELPREQRPRRRISLCHRPSVVIGRRSAGGQA
jgi:hypothetical protein